MDTLDTFRVVFYSETDCTVLILAGVGRRGVVAALHPQILAPPVALVAVGSVDDEMKGELAKAYIVLKEGASVTENEIIEFCHDSLAAYKVPRRVQFVDDVPRTSTGKIMRRMLRTLDDA